ncbi:hypothetical protein D3C80_1771860 [compost metagenome]
MLLLDRRWHQGYPHTDSHQANGGLQFVGPLADVDTHTVVGEQRQHVVGIAGPRVGWVEDERFACQLSEGKRVAHQRVALGQHGHQRVFTQYLLVDGRVIDANAPERDVNTPVFQRFHLLQRGHLA